MTALLKALTIFLFAATPILIEATAGGWWVAVSFVASSTEDRPQGPVNIISSALSEAQQRIIRNQRSPNLVETIASAAQMAINECQRQFKDRKWNCSSTNPYNVFGQILQRACRETAFVYAITAAAVSYSISRACADRQLRSCTCDKSNEGVVDKDGWQWGGCGDNIRFADKFARRFLNSAEIHKDFRARVNMHNNEAGKAAVKNNMLRQCKCHGLSQACTVKTCWNKIPDFKVIGRVLKRKFDGASQVELEQNSPGRKITFTPVNEDHKAPTRADLIYYEESPDFCSKNSKVGSLGTVGRECNRTSLGTNGCDLLCCGRGYRSEWKAVEKPCKCRFEWCCKVNCQTCKETKNVHLCL
ncbi:protein Wnt-1-like isoform X2 [Dendronephthya gigantea]|uniref:protein Wnt-1-like isoform X2 n=1 Tax=Dendronephthya gigantea TaxID=151771 RepID=UPI00106AC72A|nr:protein Wnt-1-like isoform X2 [Dendronephthya gigantea]